MSSTSPAPVCADAYAMFARTQSTAGPAGGRTTKIGGNPRSPGSNNGSVLRRYPHTTPVRLPPTPWRSTGPRHRLVRPRLPVLRPQEHRALQP
ncbi:MAG: hypothetical protein ABS81_18240 [Pseudonocardia sp. SCN 72-86]|nr:MAG: hypothetical protein ABS81_18240 [Pseudonocardia sp. SCN 72-86]